MANLKRLEKQVSPQILGGVFTDIKKQQGELEEMFSKFQELTEECAVTFDHFSDWAQKKVDAKKA